MNEDLEWVKENWSRLPHGVKGGHEAVWFVNDDIAGSYEVDEEWVGMKGDGTLVWAYASGCSCWDGEFNAGLIDKDVKAFEFNHKNMPEEFEKQLVDFVKAEKEKDV